jgi:hypothetical protein
MKDPHELMQNTARSDLAPREGEILLGSLFSEPMRVETVRSTGPQTWVLGLVGVSSERFRSVTLTAAELATLKVSTQGFTYAGDGHLLRLGLQAYALGIAYDAIDEEVRHTPQPSRESKAEQASTVLELHAGLSTDGQRVLVELLFEDLWIDPAGIVRYILRPPALNEELIAA